MAGQLEGHNSEMEQTKHWHRNIPTFPPPKDQVDRDLNDAMAMLIEQGKIEWALDEEGQMLFRSTDSV